MVFLIVLLVALMHALWNALVKGAQDRLLMLDLIATADHGEMLGD